jgi:hypothetical protein
VLAVLFALGTALRNRGGARKVGLSLDDAELRRLEPPRAAITGVRQT